MIRPTPCTFFANSFLHQEACRFYILHRPGKGKASTGTRCISFSSNGGLSRVGLVATDDCNSTCTHTNTHAQKWKKIAQGTSAYPPSHRVAVTKYRKTFTRCKIDQKQKDARDLEIEVNSKMYGLSDF